MLFLNEGDIQELLPMAEALRVVRDSFAELAGGTALNHPRRRLVLPTRSVLHYMAGSFGDYFGTKIYATNPKGAHFLFLLYRAADAQPLALMEANHLGQIRTGAASGVATSVMADPEASELAVIGSGFQAETQIEAMLNVRPIRKVRVWSRSEQKRLAFAEACSRRFQAPVTATATAQEAVEGARIVVTATSAKDPVIESGWVGEGTHINAMGSNQAGRRELPADLVFRASLIAVDSLEQAKMESGDLLLAASPGEWDKLPLVELQQLVAGSARDQASPRVTVFKSNGLAVQDVAAAAHVYERALRAGRGVKIPVFAPAGSYS
jgi:alanine dehydrogenase